MTVDESIAAAVARAVDPLTEQVRELAQQVHALRASQPPRLLSVGDAGAELGISACSVRRRIADGSLPSRRIGARVLVDMTAARPASDVEIAARAREARS